MEYLFLQRTYLFVRVCFYLLRTTLTLDDLNSPIEVWSITLGK